MYLQNCGVMLLTISDSDYKNWASIREIAKEVYADYPELFMLLDGYMKSIGK